MYIVIHVDISKCSRLFKPKMLIVHKLCAKESYFVLCRDLVLHLKCFLFIEMWKKSFSNPTSTSDRRAKYENNR